MNNIKKYVNRIINRRSHIIENISLFRANNISNFLPPISQNTVQLMGRIERISANPFFTSSKDM